MEQFINMAKKELVSPKEAARWADDHVLSYWPMPRWISDTFGGAGDDVTGRRVASDQPVLCWGNGAAESFATTEIWLSCPLVNAKAQVALVEDLPVSGVDFLLGNDLASGRV